MNPVHDFRLLTLADLERAAYVVSQAYEDDPLCDFMLPSRRTRARTLYKFFLAMGEVSIKNQRAYGVGDPLQGVAYWQFPEQDRLSISLKSLGKFLPLLLTRYPVGLYRARPVLRQIERMHSQYAPEPHFYLDNLAVLPSAQGRGLATKLLRPVLEMADAQKSIAYTDTVTPANVPLYEHFGFENVEACPAPGTGLTVFALRRPVR